MFVVPIAANLAIMGFIAFMIWGYGARLPMKWLRKMGTVGMFLTLAVLFKDGEIVANAGQMKANASLIECVLRLTTTLFLFALGFVNLILSSWMGYYGHAVSSRW